MKILLSECLLLLAGFAEGLCNELLEMNYTLPIGILKYHLRFHKENLCATWLTFGQNG